MDCRTKGIRCGLCLLTLLLALAISCDDDPVPGSDADMTDTGDTGDVGDVEQDGDASDLADLLDIETDVVEPPEGPFVDRSEQLPDIEIDLTHPAAIQPGLGLIDLEGDGDLDLVLATDGEEAYVLENDGNAVFTDVTEAAGLAGLAAGSSVGVADIDNDGDSDLYIGTVVGSTLWLNDGDGVFTDVTDDWGLGEFAFNCSADFGDFDGDGFVDLYETGNFDSTTEGSFAGEPNRLYHNTGTAFELVDPSPGAAAAPTTDASWYDFDGDGWLDLWVVNDFAHLVKPSEMWRNLGPPAEGQPWAFEDVAEDWGWDQEVFGASATLADFDNDGDFDGYISNIANNLLLVVNHDDPPVDVGKATGVTQGHFTDPVPTPEDPAEWPPYDPDSEDPFMAVMGVFCDEYCEPAPDHWVMTSWANHFSDIDHDGWSDLIVINGRVGISPILPEGSGQPNALMWNTEGTFDVEPSVELPNSRGSSRGSAVGDVDGDGDLDLFWADCGFDGQGGIVYLENIGSDGHWLIVELEGTTSNRDALGAQVVVEAGGETQMRLVGSEQGFMSVSQRSPHFGLGDASTADVTVIWPTGVEQVLEDVAVDQVLQVSEPL